MFLFKKVDFHPVKVHQTNNKVRVFACIHELLKK